MAVHHFEVTRVGDKLVLICYVCRETLPLPSRK